MSKLRSQGAQFGDEDRHRLPGGGDELVRGPVLVVDQDVGVGIIGRGDPLAAHVPKVAPVAPVAGIRAPVTGCRVFWVAAGRRPV